MRIVDISRAFLIIFQAYLKNFLCRLFTLIIHLQKKIKQAVDVYTAVAFVYFYSEEVIVIACVENRKTANRQYYKVELRQLTWVTKSKRRGKLGAGVLLLEDNVPIHQTQV